MTNTEPPNLGTPADEAAPSSVASEERIAWLFFGGGVVGALLVVASGRRSLLDWAVPLGLFGASAAILFKRRQTTLEAAERSILGELDRLDPIARAQVLASVAKRQLRRDR